MPPPTMLMQGTVLTGEVLQLSYDFAVLLGQAVVNRHGDLSQALRCALTVLLAVTDDFLHHIVGSGKSRVIWIDDKVFSCCLSGSPDDIREGNLSLEFTPVFPEVLHDPQTVDVFQVADLALYAALVGVVVFEDDSSVRIGSSSSIPIRDQVPQLKNAAFLARVFKAECLPQRKRCRGFPQR